MVTVDWHIVNEEVINAFAEYTIEKRFEKEEAILTAGDMCNQLLLIKSGFVRNFYIDRKGNDITHWFSGPNTLVTSPPSFFNREPSFFGIESIQPTVADVISYSDLEKAFAKSIQLERFARQVTTNIMIALGRKVIDLQTKSAEERYEDLLLLHPNIFQSAKLGHIAGYLGITQQSLSRIRAKQA